MNTLLNTLAVSRPLFGRTRPAAPAGDRVTEPVAEREAARQADFFRHMFPATGSLAIPVLVKVDGQPFPVANPEDVFALLERLSAYWQQTRDLPLGEISPVSGKTQAHEHAAWAPVRALLEKIAARAEKRAWLAGEPETTQGFRCREA